MTDSEFLEIGGMHFPFSIKQSANESKIVCHLFLGMLTDPECLKEPFELFSPTHGLG